MARAIGNGLDYLTFSINAHPQKPYCTTPSGFAVHPSAEGNFGRLTTNGRPVKKGRSETKVSLRPLYFC